MSNGKTAGMAEFIFDTYGVAITAGEVGHF